MSEAFVHEFKLNSAYDGQPKMTVTVTTDAEGIEDVVEAFVQYLRGCGFVCVEDLTVVYAPNNQPE